MALAGKMGRHRGFYVSTYNVEMMAFDLRVEGLLDFFTRCKHRVGPDLKIIVMPNRLQTLLMSSTSPATYKMHTVLSL